jgi:hypothetical protein
MARDSKNTEREVEEVAKCEGQNRGERLRKWLAEEMWSSIPVEFRGRQVPKEFYDSLYE